MTISNPSPDPLEEQTFSITEAAHRLGVSERTIYRMLREGKLQRVNVSDIRTKFVRLKPAKSHEIMFELQVKDPRKVGHNLDKLSDRKWLETMESMQRELREKDVQIASLIEQQRELTQTLQRLQDQMFELARLTLSQNAAVVPSANARRPDAGKGSVLARLFARGEKSDEAK